MTGCSGHRGCGRWDLGDPSRCSGLRDHKLDPWPGGCGRWLGHRGCCSGGRGGLGCCCCYYGCGSLGGLAGGQWTRPGQTGDGGADQGKDFDSGVLPNFCSFAKTQPVKKRGHRYIYSNGLKDEPSNPYETHSNLCSDVVRLAESSFVVDVKKSEPSDPFGIVVVGFVTTSSAAAVTFF